jgi:hypothetical protein
VETRRREDNLARFGFSFERGGAHLARSMMFDDLRLLFQQIPEPDTERSVFAKAILEDNCLGKRSAQTRSIALRHLVNLYALDPSIPLYRAMRYFWHRDPEGQPLLVCLLAYARDAILRMSAPFILQMPTGTPLVRQELEHYLEVQAHGRFSNATLKSTAQNVSTTWTHAGHINGIRKKTRATASATAGTVSFALLMGYIEGARGKNLLKTNYIKLLDCSFERVIDLSEQASRRGWIVLKRVGDVIEVLFPNLIHTQEMEWLREQN